MSVWKVPVWLCDPCEGQCDERGVHSHHIKWWARWLYRLGLVQ